MKLTFSYLGTIIRSAFGPLGLTIFFILIVLAPVWLFLTGKILVWNHVLVAQNLPNGWYFAFSQFVWILIFGRYFMRDLQIYGKRKLEGWKNNLQTQRKKVVDYELRQIKVKADKIFLQDEKNHEFSLLIENRLKVYCPTPKVEALHSDGKVLFLPARLIGTDMLVVQLHGILSWNEPEVKLMCNGQEIVFDNPYYLTNDMLQEADKTFISKGHAFEKKVEIKFGADQPHLSDKIIYAFDLLIDGKLAFNNLVGNYQPDSQSLVVPLKSIKNCQCRGKEVQLRYVYCKSVHLDFTPSSN